MVNASDHGQLWRDSGFNFKAEVVQQLGEVLSEGAFVVADRGVVTDALDESQAQPRLNPETDTKTEDAL